MEQVNGFVHIRCSNCNKTTWILESDYIRENNIINYFFCEKGCEVSYKLRNQHIKFKKHNEDLFLKENNKKVILVGTISYSEPTHK